MRASTATFVHSTKTPRLGIRSPSKSGLARSLTASVLFLLLVSVTACATKSAYTGHEATDLSPVKPGALRSAIESTIGEPEKVEQQDSAVVAWYVVDRGYVGTLEENSLGEKLLWAPVMAWGEFVSFGLGGWMIACATPCQKGWLVVVYEKDGRVISVSEDVLPDDHPLVASCTRSAVRANVAVCQSVRERVRPSSLPGSGPDPDHDGPGEQSNKMTR